MRAEKRMRPETRFDYGDVGKVGDEIAAAEIVAGIPKAAVAIGARAHLAEIAAVGKHGVGDRLVAGAGANVQRNRVRSLGTGGFDDSQVAITRGHDSIVSIWGSNGKRAEYRCSGRAKCIAA